MTNVRMPNVQSSMAATFRTGLDDFPCQEGTMAGLSDIENRLREILDAVRAGRNERLDPLLDELEALVAAFEAAAGSAAREDIERIRALWEEAALTLATAGQAARGELRHVATGRKTLKAYNPN